MAGAEPADPGVAGTGVAGLGLDGPGVAAPGLDGPGVDGPGLDGLELEGPGVDRPGLDGLGLGAGLELGAWLAATLGPPAGLVQVGPGLGWLVASPTALGPPGTARPAKAGAVLAVPALAGPAPPVGAGLAELGLSDGLGLVGAGLGLSDDGPLTGVGEALGPGLVTGPGLADGPAGWVAWTGVWDTQLAATWP